MNFLNMNMLVAGGAVAGIAGLWNQIKGFFSQLKSCFILTILVNSELYERVENYLNEKYTPWKLNKIFYFHDWNYNKVLKKNGMLIKIHGAQDTIQLYFKKWKPIWLLISRGKDQNPQTSHRISTIRGCINLQKILIEISDKTFETTNKQIYYNDYRIIYKTGRRKTSGSNETSNDGKSIAAPVSESRRSERYLKWKPEEIGEETSDAFRFLAIDDNIKFFLRDLEHWFLHKDWFRERGIVWKRGWLLYGEPGTGKTTLIRAIAQKYGIPIYVIDLGSMNNIDLIECWQNITTNQPHIILIEDIDAIFDGRKNMVNGNELTFDCLLNCLDGAKTSEGRLLMITSNHWEKLDPALGTINNGNGISTRPGRIDRVLKLSFLNLDGKYYIAKIILSDFPELIEQVVKESKENETPAQFQERCKMWAERKFWEGK